MQALHSVFINILYKTRSKHTTTIHLKIIDKNKEELKLNQKSLKSFKKNIFQNTKIYVSVK